MKKLNEYIDKLNGVQIYFLGYILSFLVSLIVYFVMCYFIDNKIHDTINMLLFFGLIPAVFGIIYFFMVMYMREAYNSLQINSKINEYEEKLLYYENLFQKPDNIKPEISFDDFKKSLDDKTKEKFDVVWHLYYKKYYLPSYTAYYLRTLSFKPELFNEFIYACTKFDWVDTLKYMQDTNWTWGSDEKVPDIYHLQENVIELFINCIQSMDNESYESNVWSCGGFIVSVYLDKVENKHKVKIEFEKLK